MNRTPQAMTELKIWRRIALLTLTTLTLLALEVEAQSIPGVEVLGSNSQTLELEVTPQIEWKETLSGDLLPILEGGLLTAGSDATPIAGAPIVPQLRLPIALPTPVGTRFEVLEVEYAPIRTGRLAPTPTLTTDDEGVVLEEYRVNQNLYRAHRPEREFVTFEYGGVARGLHIGAIAVSPVRFDPVSQQIETLQRVRVRLRYGVSDRTMNARPVRGSEGLRAGVLNSAQVSNWALREQVARPFARRSSVGNARAWFRVEVGEDGLHAITAEDFEEAGITPSSVQNVAVYGGPGTPLPEDVLAAPDNQMTQVPIIVEKNGNTISRVLFYGDGPSGWEYKQFDIVDSLARRVNNPYANANSYLVAVDGDPGRTFEIEPNPGQATVTPAYGIARILFEEDLTNAIAQGNSGNGGGRDWVGSSMVVDSFRPEEKRVFTQELIGLERSYPVTYRIRVAHNAEARSQIASFSFEQNGSPVGEELSLWSHTDDQIAGVADEVVFSVPANTIASDNKSLLGITYRFSQSATGYLDFYEVHYGRKLAARENTITFESPTGSGVAEYRITGFGTNQLIGFDVTDPAAPKRLDPVSTDGGSYTFRGPLSGEPTERRRYHICAITEPKGVQNVSTVPYAGLRENDLSADILVVVPEEFRATAERYAEYRNNRGLYKASVVTTDEIYTEFSHGRLDPTAIRDYVAHAYHNWNNPPRYLLLFGDGHYDFRNITTNVPQQVPIYTTGERESFNDLAVSVYDDYFVRVDGDDFYIDLAPGRIPVNSVEDAETVVDKIISYESPKSYGPWRERVLLIADDNIPDEGGGFLPQSEKLEKLYLPDFMESEKIYLHEYPTVQGIRRMKPGATQDMIQWMNRGVLIANWVGHGNARVWGHEHVLEKDEFVPQLTNDSTLMLLMAVTCNFGRFDNPNEVSGGELFLTHKGGGASAVLATTRAVYINDNARLMEAYFQSLFLRDSITNNFLPLGDALMATKIRSGASRDNDQKYLIFGDPVMKLNIPTDSVAISTVNQVDVTTDTARISALSLVEVVGGVYDRNGALKSDFDGSVILTLYDADRTKVVEREDRPGTYDILKKGGQLFRGPAIVENGQFTAQFRVPKDIAYDSTRTGSLYAYAYSDGEDGVGSTDNVLIYGSDPTSEIETVGPDITIYLDDRSFRSGDVVTPSPMLIVDLEDESGINASGAGIGHRIEAWIGENPDPIDLTDFYTTSAEDYRVGSAEREILDLLPGEYRVRVRAWDIFNNPSEGVAYFRILEGEAGDLVVTDVLNYPNPMGRATEFLFRHNQSAPLSVTVDIFTPAGRKIRRLEDQNVTDRFVRIPWDGHDADGNRVANGVYFYRLRVSMGEGDEEQVVEVIEKVAVAR